MPEPPESDSPPVSSPQIAQNWSEPPAQPGVSSSSGHSPIEELIPAKNVNALLAYYFGVFALIPCLGLILGIGAVVLGIRGKQACERDPNMPGKAHAWAGIVLGLITFLANAAAIAWIFFGSRSSA